MSRSMVGFDLGAGELKLVQWDGARIRRAVHTPLPDHLIRDGIIVSYEAMADFIKETARANRISGGPCAVTLPAPLVYLRRVTLPAMTQEQLAINLPYEFRDFLSMSKDKYFYDYSVNALTKGEGELPDQLDLTAAAAAKETIQDYRDMFRRAGFRLKTALPAECAYSNLLRAGGAGQEQEYCLVDLGHRFTRVHIFSGPRFEATRNIELGMAAVDRAVAELLGVDEHLARTYKETNHQNVQQSDPAIQIYNSIALDIRKAVNFYSFNNRESTLRTLWCGGGGAYIPALMDALRPAVPLELHTIDELMPGLDGETADPLFFAAAAGAAMQ